MDKARAQFNGLMQQLREGTPDAFSSLVEQYGHHVYRAVRRKLHRRLRTRFDSEDFVQAVWASFYERRGRLHEFATPEDLVGFLATVAGHKVIEENRRAVGAKRRNVMIEVPLEGPARMGMVKDRTPSPSQAAAVNELWRQVISGERSMRLRMVEMRGAGATYEEIARELGVNERTVRRVIDRAQRRVTR